MGETKKADQNELHYEIFRDTFNAGRTFIGMKIVSEAIAFAAQQARFAVKAAAKRARQAAAAAHRHHPPQNGSPHPGPHRPSPRQ